MNWNFKFLGDLVGNSLKSLNLEHKAREKSAVSVWSDVVGNRIAKAACAETIRDGILFVGCKSATWANELTFLKNDIITKLNKKVGGNYVKDIRFSVRSSRHTPLEEARVEEPDDVPEKEFEGIQLSTEELQKIEETALAAGSEELADRIRKAMTTGLKLEHWKKSHGWKTCESCGSLFNEEGNNCPHCNKYTG